MKFFDKIFGRGKRKAELTPPIDVSKLGADFDRVKAHVIARFREQPLRTEPFYHSYVEQVFPIDFYGALHECMTHYKHSDKVKARTQDSAEFKNRRFPLAHCPDKPIIMLRALFEDQDVKLALLEKFYLNAGEALINHVDIHLDEFEFVFCAPDRFQNIHVDIPAKYMSFVFYLPTREVTEEEAERNATVLYDRHLKPVYSARFLPNSVGIFVPHFYSYHGFSSTIERDVIVLFLVNRAELDTWKTSRSDGRDEGPTFEAIANMIEEKMNRYPLIEYGDDPGRVARERAACKINAPQGRVMID